MHYIEPNVHRGIIAWMGGGMMENAATSIEKKIKL